METIGLSFSDKILHVARSILNDIGISPARGDIWDRIFVFIAILVFATLIYLLFNKVLIRIVHFIVTHTSTRWDMLLYNNRFFRHLFWLIPPSVVLLLLPLAFSDHYPKLMLVLQMLISIFLAIIFARILISVLQTSYDYYLMKQGIKKSPYKGVIEMTRLFIIIMTVIVIIGIILDIKISHVITGMSAFAAVLVLVFKDTLLGFVAGIQLTQNKMIHIGDWITVPNTNANGVITDITILTVQVQNFDNTYVYVPAYTLVTNSFQNWIGMCNSGVRRSKKQILLDIHSIRLSDEALLEQVYADPLVQKYLSKQGFTTFEQDKSIDKRSLQTNLGLFRIWLNLMLLDDAQVSKDPYIVIQDLTSDGAGYPLQLLFFVNTTDWVTYERIQSRIGEQIMSVLGHFDLRLFQFPDWVDAPENPVKQKLEAKTPSDNPASVSPSVSATNNPTNMPSNTPTVS